MDMDAERLDLIGALTGAAGAERRFSHHANDGCGCGIEFGRLCHHYVPRGRDRVARGGRARAPGARPSGARDDRAGRLCDGDAHDPGAARLYRTHAQALPECLADQLCQSCRTVDRSDCPRGEMGPSRRHLRFAAQLAHRRHGAWPATRRGLPGLFRPESFGLGAVGRSRQPGCLAAVHRTDAALESAVAGLAFRSRIHLSAWACCRTSTSTTIIMPIRPCETFYKAGQSRGEQIAALNAQLFADLRRRKAQGDLDGMLAAYRTYLGERGGSYMVAETGGGIIVHPSRQTTKVMQASRSI